MTLFMLIDNRRNHARRLTPTSALNLGCSAADIRNRLSLTQDDFP
jgi:hypothetical protein